MATINVTAHGAKPNDTNWDSGGLQRARNACKFGDTLLVPAGFYNLEKRLDWTAPFPIDVSARHASFRWRGTEPGPVVTYGGTDTEHRMIGSRIDGLTIDNMAADRWAVNNSGIQLQNLGGSDVQLGSIIGFRQGVELSGVVAYARRISFDVSRCKYGLTVDQSNPEFWWGALPFHGCRFGDPGPLTGIPPYDSAAYIYIPAAELYRAGSWQFFGGAFEGNDDRVGLVLDAIADVDLFGVHFETGPGKMTLQAGDTRGHISIHGGNQAGLRVETAGQSVVQHLANGETIYHGRPHVVKGNLEMNANMRVQP